LVIITKQKPTKKFCNLNQILWYTYIYQLILLRLQSSWCVLPILFTVYAHCRLLPVVFIAYS